jgi:hypothetical protein
MIDRSAPFALLVRHFIGAGLAPDLLSETGADYFRRALFGVLAMLLVLGLFITRIFFDRYTNLNATIGREIYNRAVQADSLFMIAVPMLVIGLAAVIAGPMLFPDETDYRVLTPLPISRAFLFGAKLVSVVVIVSLAIIAVNIVATFWFPIAQGGRKASHGVLERVIAHGLAATAGSYFMCLAVMAIQGLTIVAVPHAWQRRIGVAIQASLCVGLLLSLPVLGRMPRMEVTEATITSGWLAWLPPAWFFGIERWWLDGAAAGGYVDAARVGMIATAIVLVLVVICYAALYRSAERLAGVTGADRRMLRMPGAPARWLASRMAPQTLAIVSFVRAAIGRSRLHQFVFLFSLGGGIALVVGEVIAAMEGLGPMSLRRSAAVQAAISAPLVGALTFVIGLRAAYRWPLDRQAAWIFRLTEDPRTRSMALDGAAWCLSWGAWAVAMLILLLVQPRSIGSSWWMSALLTSLAVMALAEFMLMSWHRIPFACSYLPGARILAYHLGVLSAQFFVFVIIGGSLIRWGVGTPLRALTIGGFLLALVAAFRRERLTTWGLLPLEFEDDDPAEASRLGL